MAIYHCSVQVIGRSNGRSATGAAAYRSGMEITDDRTGITHDYTRKSGVDHAEIMAPANAPAWVHDRSQLWNTVEKTERRKDSQLAREVEVSIPRELPRDQMQALVRNFVHEQFVSQGMVADVAFHHLDSENPHAHIMLTMRELGPDGFGKKQREWNRTELLQSWRVEWEHHTNTALERGGFDQRIDHRTLDAQGVDRTPQIHLGPQVIQMEQRGIRTDRGAVMLAIDNNNAEIQELTTLLEVIDRERDSEIARGAERGATGGGDRTAGASAGLTGGGIDGGSGGAEISSPGSSQVPTPGTRRTQKDDGEDERRDSDSRRDGGHRPASSFWLELEAFRRRARRFRGFVGGAVGRVVALAGTRVRQPGRKRLADPEGQIARQVAALDGPFEVVISGRSGRQQTRNWSGDRLLAQADWLARQVAMGGNIAIQPQGTLIIGRLNADGVERLRQLGFEPALVLETAPDRFEAIIRITDQALNIDQIHDLGSALARRAGGQVQHHCSLAGFSSMSSPRSPKPEGFTAEIISNPGQPASKAAEASKAVGVEPFPDRTPKTPENGVQKPTAPIKRPNRDDNSPSPF